MFLIFREFQPQIVLSFLLNMGLIKLFLLKKDCIKKRLQYACFPMKYAKILRTSFFIEHLQWLLLFTPPYLHLLAYTYLDLLVYT